MLAFCAAFLATAGTHGAPLTDRSLVSALRQGGYVLVMRHASSPARPPDPAAAQPDNPNDERELDRHGIESARAMGEAIRQLEIPIDEVESSPAYRALQTVENAGLRVSQRVPELGEGGPGSEKSAAARRAGWLEHRVTEPPRTGTNALLVTHAPNLLEAFGQKGKDVAEGETLVFKPDGKGSAPLVARIKMDDWPAFAAKEQLR